MLLREKLPNFSSDYQQFSEIYHCSGSGLIAFVENVMQPATIQMICRYRQPIQIINIIIKQKGMH